MFKLKLINKPKMIKLKCGFSFPDIVLANLQEKETTPTKEMQQIIADQQYDGLSKVVVNAIPDEYIIPSGEIEITANGNYNVTDKASARVSVPVKTLTTKTITANGTYNATDDNADGYSQVTVETSGVDINDYYNLTEKRTFGEITYYIKTIPLIDTSSYTNMRRFFANYTSLESVPLLDTHNVSNMNGMFTECKKLKSVPTFNTSNATVLSQMFKWCVSLRNIPKLDCSKVIAIYDIVYCCNRYMELGGFENLGKGYKSISSITANYSDCTLDLSSGSDPQAPNNVFSTNISHDSLMNVINNLYDIASDGVPQQRLILGSTNKSKLTAEEIQIATDKGFSVS